MNATIAPRVLAELQAQRYTAAVRSPHAETALRVLTELAAAGYQVAANVDSPAHHITAAVLDELLPGPLTAEGIAIIDGARQRDAAYPEGSVQGPSADRRDQLSIIDSLIFNSTVATGGQD